MFLRKLLFIVSITTSQVAFAEDISDINSMFYKVDTEKCQNIIQQLTKDVSFNYNGIVKQSNIYIGTVNNPGVYRTKNILLLCNSNDMMQAFKFIINKNGSNQNYIRYNRIFSQWLQLVNQYDKPSQLTTYSGSGKLMLISSPNDDYEMSITVKLQPAFK